MSKQRISRGKPRNVIQDVIADNPTDQGARVKPDLNRTTAEPDFQPVPEMSKNRVQVFVEALQTHWFVLTCFISIAFGVGAFLIFKSDLQSAQKEIASHSKALDSHRQESFSLDKRLITVEKDVDFVDQRLSSSELELRNLKALSQLLEKQQAILSDRSDRSDRSSTPPIRD